MARPGPRSSSGTRPGGALSGVGSSSDFAAGERLEACVGAVEAVAVADGLPRGRVLPDGVKAPACRQGPCRGGVSRKPQWIDAAELARVAGALIPPVGGGVEDG